MVIISKWCIAVCFTAKLIATSGTDDALLSAENKHINISSEHKTTDTEITELPQSITPDTNHHIHGGIFKLTVTPAPYTNGIPININGSSIIGTIHSIPETESRCFCHHTFERITLNFQREGTSYKNPFPILTKCTRITDDQKLIQQASDHYMSPSSEAECQIIIQEQKASINEIARSWLEQFKQ
jgi:hypothetical protein